MGRRPLQLLITAALVALGIWFVATRETAPQDGDGGPAENVPAATAEQDATLKPLSGSGERTLVEATGGPTSWTVLARIADGRPAEDAQIVAVSGTTQLSGAGTAVWDDVLPGTWRLRVTSAKGQVIERDVTLRPGEENKTYVRLGMPATVTGNLVNTRGERLVSHLVCFLRKGEQVPDEAGKLRGLTSASSDIAGNFEVELPETGRWRPVVIYGGRVLFEGDFEELKPDGLRRRCNIVVPAKPRLVITMEGFDQIKEAGELVAVSVYRPKTPEEFIKEAEYARLRRERTPPTVDDQDSEDAKGEFLRAKAAAEDPERLAIIEKQKKWLKVVPEGWRSIGSSIIPESGRLVFDHLDHDREYRLATRKGNEVFRIDSSVYIGFGEVLRAHLTPPSPVADPESLDSLRRCAIALRPVTVGGEPLAPGATWDR